MPVVTQERKSRRQVPHPGYDRLATGYPIHPDVFDLTFVNGTRAPVQKTTSFRTRVSEGDIDHSDKLFSGGTWSSSTSTLRDPWFSKGSSYDTGHPFYTEDTWYDGVSHPAMKWRNRDHTYVLLPDLKKYGEDLWDFSYASERPSLITQGVQAIRDTIPTKSPAALAEALFELKREGLPKVSGALSRLLSARDVRSLGSAAGGAHLTSEFGIKPIIRDLEDVLHVFRNHGELLANYQRGASEKQHRQRYWDPVREHSVDGYTSSSAQALITEWTDTPASYHDISVDGTGELVTERTVSTTDYFKGAYIYHFPEDLKPSGVNRLAFDLEYLLGLKPNLSLLWELAPWSWLADWKLNIGSNIANAEALRSDGLVMLYGYMMRETHYTALRSVHGLVHDGQSLGPVTCRYNKVVKERIRATPYGFGMDPDSFTTKQWSILGALGLTKGGNSLRLND